MCPYVYLHVDMSVHGAVVVYVDADVAAAVDAHVGVHASRTCVYMRVHMRFWHLQRPWHAHACFMQSAREHAVIRQMYHNRRAWRPREIAPTATLHIFPWIIDCPCSHGDPCLVLP